jgi:hypothetical protein
MAKHIISAGVITDFGLWRYEPLTPTQAASFVEDGTAQSAIGYAETAMVLSEIVGQDVPVNRVIAVLGIGDQALVIRPRNGYRFSPEDKGNLTSNFIREHVELGLLTHVE